MSAFDQKVDVIRVKEDANKRNYKGKQMNKRLNMNSNLEIYQ